MPRKYNLENKKTWNICACQNWSNFCHWRLQNVRSNLTRVSQGYVIDLDETNIIVDVDRCFVSVKAKCKSKDFEIQPKSLL